MDTGFATRRSTVRAAGALLAASFLTPAMAACGGPAASTGGESAAPSGPLVQLTVHGQGTS
ncbi:MAG TPA: hypothetical protein VNM48_16300, partial [Chloroflexota bacterium]|nr:hypothetical protein [Chloroflexota bacterium]